MQGRSLSHAGEAQESDKALGAHSVKCIGGAVLAKHILKAHGFAPAGATLHRDLGVKLEQVDRVASQALEAGLQRALDRVPNVLEVVA